MLYSMNRILACTDFSENSDEVLRAADELARRHHGTVDLLYVSELGLQLGEILNETMANTYRGVFLGDLKLSIEGRAMEQIRRCSSMATPIFRDGEVSEQILQLADSGNYDLVIMGHGRKPVYKQFLGSNSFKVVSSVQIPLLVVKRPLKLHRIAGLIDESRPSDKVIIGTYDFLRNFQCDKALFVSLWMDFPAPFGNSDGGAEVNDKLNEEITHFQHPGEKVELIVEPTKDLKLAYPLEKILRKHQVDVAVVKRFSEGNLKRVYIGSTTKRLLEIFEGNLLVLPAE